MNRIIFLLALYVVFVSCSTKHDSHEHAAQVRHYTCPMHPNVDQPSPGKCPICGMDLVIRDSAASAVSNNDVMLSDTQIRLANITTRRLTPQLIGQSLLANGKLVIDANRSESVTSRVAGRIDKLYVKETGRNIKKGEPLYQLYSETLLTLQREYLLAKEQYETLGSTEKRYKSFYDAAKRKLLLYGLPEKQIDVLGNTKNLQNAIVIPSPSTGTIAELSVTEGQYVSEGTILMRLEDINQLWVEAELYPSETSLFNVGDKITVRISGYEDEPIETVIDFMSPGYSENGHVVAVRASVPNTKLKYTPGMQAQVRFSYSTREALALPIDAVIRDERGSHVFVQRGHNTFRSEMVKTGMENFENVEIVEGLTEGDTVVVTGAYLLHSEIVLKKGSSPMAEHNH